MSDTRNNLASRRMDAHSNSRSIAPDSAVRAAVDNNGGSTGQDHVIESKIDFHHPYTPYAIQEEFMSTVYRVLEEGKVGILESPTGTGKSLSLICGSLTWLRHRKGKALEEGLKWSHDTSDEPEWMIEQTKARKLREMLRTREDMEARLAKVRAKEKAQRERYLKGDQKHKKRRTETVNGGGEALDEEHFILDDYDSDAEQYGSRKGGAARSGLSAGTLELMEKLGMGIQKEEDVEAEDEMKIFYCSRTHSQLTQFINELRRVNFPPAIATNSNPSKDPEIEDIKHVTLGSRKNLCIDPAVNKLNSLTAINERCLELQQPSTSQEHKCAFLPNRENQTLVNDFRDHALATIRDIEDMGSLGKELNICPYYASRAAIKPAEIVTLPYPLLLQRSAREALGVSLRGHVVIIDEGHNLIDAIAGIHGVEVSLRQLKRARTLLSVYLQKFRNRLKGKNRVYLAQVVRVIDSLAGYLEGRLAIPNADGVIDEKELLSGKGVDQINLFKLIKYLQESKLARKVEGYAAHTSTTVNQGPNATSNPRPESTTPVLHHISSLLSALTHPSKEGRLFYSKDATAPDNLTLKFLLLDPSTSFQEIVSQAHAVLLAGGTMSPMTDYTSHLFPYLAPASITTLSCGHVIPEENLVAWTLSRGPSGQDFDFTFANRNNGAMIDDLGLGLLNLCTVVPDGIVAFFPSYSYLDTVLQRWSLPSATSHAASKSIYQRLEAKKALFTDCQSQNAEMTLASYARAIDSSSNSKGALLLSVVGGKMSEGINFSDRLGRCVVIIGLPFPNIHSAAWKAKIGYIESATRERLLLQRAQDTKPSHSQTDPSKIKTHNTNPTPAPPPSNATNTSPLTTAEIETHSRAAAREHYTNACMRAVNQSVGRAIRHRDDYAAIIMLDRRFSDERVWGKLPGWIRRGLVVGSVGENGFSGLMGRLGTFFGGRKGG